MDTNIKFESNVYPVAGRVTSDKEFLSKVWDYNRLRAIVTGQGTSIPLSSLQRKIIQELPTCSLNKEDPCWGMVKKNSEYRWVSMCTKTECRFFSSCRSQIPFEEEKEKDFIPNPKVSDEYGYKRFLAEYSPAPVLIGDDTEYEYDLTKKTKKSEYLPGAAEPALFAKLIRDAEKTGEIENDLVYNASEEPRESDPIPEESTAVLIDSASENQISEIPEVDLSDPHLNIFDYFVECSQEDIIKASPCENFFVDAGPGTGKTYTLIQKLNYMVTVEEVEADGILVLCFTNAAVDEIKTRLKQLVNNGADRSLINVDIRTFHSFAWWLINQANTVLTDDGWRPVRMQGLSYESSLICADNIVAKFGKEVVGNWEYFIVDEVQDLTNSLGRLVLRIINACLAVNCGVTVLGDACQAIYDYEQETAGAALKSGEFYKALFRKMYGTAKFVSLSENHRQNSELIQLTSGIRTAILSADSNKLTQEVSKLISSAETLSEGSTSINSDFIKKIRSDGSVSMLFRNNGQTLKMSSDLRKRGIAHTLNVTETKNNFATWIADIFGQYGKSNISEDKFLDLFEEYTGKSGNEVWSRLQRLMHTDDDVLAVRELLDAIAVSKIDDSLLRQSKIQDVVVSNIHRSKGREYDCVVVDKSFVDSLSSYSSLDEYKTLYVAITRPKKRLLLAPMQGKAGMKVITVYATGRKRWGKARAKMLSYLEFDGAKDISSDIFACTPLALFDDIKIGDAVVLNRTLKAGRLEYSIVLEDTDKIIGTIGESSPFIQDFISYMKIDSNSYVELPSSINDLYVSGVYSQVVDSKYLELHPEIRDFAPNGVWKWVELVGIGHADYDVY